MNGYRGKSRSKLQLVQRQYRAIVSGITLLVIALGSSSMAFALSEIIPPPPLSPHLPVLPISQHNETERRLRQLAEQEIDSLQLEASQTYEQARIDYSEGNYQSALANFQHALMLWNALENSNALLDTLYSLGATNQELNHPDLAIAYYAEALSGYREVGNQAGEARTLVSLSSIYFEMGQYVDSIHLLETISESFDNEEFSAERAFSLYYLGRSHRFLGNYGEAEIAYQDALQLYEQLGDSRRQTTILIALGYLQNFIGQPEDELNYYQRALHIARENNDLESIAYALNNSSDLLTELGRYTEALEYLVEARPILESLNDARGLSWLLDSLGNVYGGLENIEQARISYQQALAISQDLGDRATSAEILQHFGALYVQQQQPEMAITFYKQAVNELESIRSELQALDPEQQQSYTETVAETYRTLADLLLSQGQILEAQQVLELLKIQELEEYSRGSVINIETQEVQLTPLENEIWDEFGGLIALGRAIATCEESTCDPLRDQLVALNQEFNNTVDGLIGEFQQRLDEDRTALDPDHFFGEASNIIESPNTVLIYPIILQDKLWVLWASAGTQENMTSIVLNSIEVPVSQAELSDAVLCFRQLLGNPFADQCETRGQTTIEAIAQELYQYLIPPQLEDELVQNNIQNLIFSLDRVTRYIPMAALYDGEQYLIQRFTVSTILSAGLTRQDNPLPTVQEASVLALGLSEAVPENFAEQVPAFDELPYVPIELDGITGIYPGQQLLNSEFSDRAFYELPNYNILHIATHGQFIPINEGLSYLVLGTKQPFRIHRIEDFQQFFADLSMVVLSACETALGAPDQNGIEINGLAHTFIRAGTNAVMASLWQVNDGSTSLLMQQFYHHLAEGMSIAEALQHSQIQFIENDVDPDMLDTVRGALEWVPESAAESDNQQLDLSHPYYWAPFILIGDSH